MANIDFVPNDYIQKRDSTRANLLYLFLFIVVMAGIGATFSVIKMRQKDINDTYDIQCLGMFTDRWRITYFFFR